MTVEEILDIKLKGIDVDPVELKMLIEEVKESILNFTNRSEVPKPLNFVWANMVVDYINYLQMSRKPDDEGSESGVEGLQVKLGKVTKIKIGDTDFSLSDDSSTTFGVSDGSHSVNLDEIVLNYKDQLMQYRRIW